MSYSHYIEKIKDEDEEIVDEQTKLNFPNVVKRKCVRLNPKADKWKYEMLNGHWNTPYDIYNADDVDDNDYIDGVILKLDENMSSEMCRVITDDYILFFSLDDEKELVLIQKNPKSYESSDDMIENLKNIK
jgi:hypothetical protein